MAMVMSIFTIIRTKKCKKIHFLHIAKMFDKLKIICYNKKHI